MNLGAERKPVTDAQHMPQWLLTCMLTRAMASPVGSKFRHVHKRDRHRHTHFTKRKGAPSAINFTPCYQFVFVKFSILALLHTQLQSGRFYLWNWFDYHSFFTLYSLDFEENRLKINIIFDLLDVQIFQHLYFITDCINSVLLQNSVFCLITTWSRNRQFYLVPDWYLKQWC